MYKFEEDYIKEQLKKYTEKVHVLGIPVTFEYLVKPSMSPSPIAESKTITIYYSIQGKKYSVDLHKMIEYNQLWQK